MITYYKLWDMLKRKGMNKGDLKKAIQCGSDTITAMSKNQYVNMKTIDKICDFLDCQPGDIIEHEKPKNM